MIDRDSSGKPKMLNGKTKMIRKFLSKGDNNPVDDRGLYPRGSMYLDETFVVGHVFA